MSRHIQHRVRHAPQCTARRPGYQGTTAAARFVERPVGRPAVGEVLTASTRADACSASR